MDRTKLACFSLMASAFVLAGLLLAQLPAQEKTAQGHMLTSKSRYTAMTTQTSKGEEALFVLDDTDHLLIYTTDLSRAGRGQPGQIKFLQAVDLQLVFKSVAEPK